jgi:predicted alpha/beta hydrolase family esterase
MQGQVLFVHSAGSQGPEVGSDHLLRYLQAHLGADFEVFSPKMPDPEHPRYVNWKLTLEKQFIILPQELILVGHSLGGSVLLKYLSEETVNKSIIGLFLVAVPYWGGKEWEIEEYRLPFDFESKLPPIPNIFLYHSRKDSWVPFPHLLHYAEKLPQAKVRVLEGSEHEFCNGLPELIGDIKNIAKYGRSV